MTIYNFLYVHPDKLYSPINGYSCRRITKQNIKQFGFDNIKDLHSQYPNFPLICKEYQKAVGNDPNNSRKNTMIYLGSNIRKENERSYYKNPKKCLRCCNVISYNKRSNNYCSQTCSNSDRKHSEETKRKLSIINTKEITINICIQCKQPFTHNRRKTCSNECLKKYQRSKSCSSDLNLYRLDCSFKFNVYDYPEEFDLDLIEKHGWYKAYNRGNNLNGVSRDHIISIKYGFINKIDPDIMSHPANCQLMLHKDNISKYSNNGISLQELLDKIENWNKKYNK